MNYAVNCAALSVALDKLGKLIVKNEQEHIKTVVFCEDRLTLAAERTVCSAVGGTFDTSVYTLARFLSTALGKPENVLSGQGSAMAVRKIIEEHRDELTLLKRLSASGAAGQVYDTIALLYSSRVSAEDAFKAAGNGGILGGKLRDIAVIYSAYNEYLRESGFQDRNAYLKKLPDVIATSDKICGNCVVFLGFQAFTCTSGECVRAAMSVAKDVYGLFIGGSEDVYVNEAGASFMAYSKEFGGVKISTANDGLIPEADFFRSSIFNAESFLKPQFKTDRVTVFEAGDYSEELEFVAANIKKFVAEGEKYAKISVMLPDVEKGERELSRVFSQFNIPYFADRQLSLAEHQLCAFVCAWLTALLSGCRQSDVDEIVASPFFPAELRQKDVFRNYLLRLANFRGGVRKQPDCDTLTKMNFDPDSVNCVRQTFLDGLACFSKKGGSKDICRGIRSLLELYGVEEKLKDTAEKFADLKPAQAQFGARAYESVLTVLAEAESICPDDIPLTEFIKILKSGFSAMKISLIPPKADAVFVGGLGTTANTGSNVVFAVQLTGEVPNSSSDTALLTDREITALEGVNLNISPKIRQVNARRQETCALNLCAFRNKLFLTYSAGETGASEIIKYALGVFATPDGRPLKCLDMRRHVRQQGATAMYCSEKLPALRYLRKYAKSAEAPSVYAVLKKYGFGEEAEAMLENPVKRNISCGKQLYFKDGSISPTTLETYFQCPYLNFMSQGLKLSEREEGAVRPNDTGNFIHDVLRALAFETDKIKTAEEFALLSRQVAEDLLSKPPYSALSSTKSGEYTADKLLSETVKICGGMYEHINNSSFKVVGREKWDSLTLPDGVKVKGKIDRVDESDKLVRIIDYKTGSIKSEPKFYYSGLKLQLPLYLLAASQNKEPAGAYYFPASVRYKSEKDGVFRLQGFMSGDVQTVSASDVTLKASDGTLKMGKSDYISARINNKGCVSFTNEVMPPNDFPYFLRYSALVAGNAATEMEAGNIQPSPIVSYVYDSCEYCKAGGSCGLCVKETGSRQLKTVSATDIARIVREKEDEK